MTRVDDKEQKEQKEIEYLSVNSDQRVRKKPTKYDDRLSPFVRHVTATIPELGHLALDVKTWELPKGIRVVHSTVSAGHADFMERKRNNKRKGGR